MPETFMDERANTRSFPRWLRVLIPVGLALCTVEGIIRLVYGEIVSGIVLLGLAAGVIVLHGVKAKRAERLKSTSFLVVQAFVFFGAISVGGVALFVLAVLGRIAIPSGVLGLMAGVGAAY